MGSLFLKNGILIDVHEIKIFVLHIKIIVAIKLFFLLKIANIKKGGD